jgi:hypothetical protein
MNGVHQGHLALCRSAMQELLNLFSSLKISKLKIKQELGELGDAPLGVSTIGALMQGGGFVVFRPMQVLNFEYSCHCKFNKLIQKHMYLLCKARLQYVFNNKGHI